MFQSSVPSNFPSNQQRILRSSKNSSQRGVADENKITSQQQQQQQQQMPGKSTTVTGKGLATRALAKRNALEDVSNVQSNAAAAVKIQRAKTGSSMNASQARVKVYNPAAKNAPFKTAEHEKKKIIAKVHQDSQENEDEELMSAARSHEKEMEEKRKISEARNATVVWDDLDAVDAGDPLMVSQYVVEIMEYMRELEKKIMPNPKYLTSQPEIRASMRSILIDWLVEVHWKFKLLPETLFLTVNIIDRFLSLRVVHLSKLQLVGVVAMLIASKYEEILAPSVSNFVYLSDNGFDDRQIIEAERYVLAALGFNLAYPNPMVFLRRVSKAEDYDIQTRTVAKYLMEITLIDQGFIATHPSMIAASAILLARKMLDRGEWHGNLIHYSGYHEDELEDCVAKMVKSLRDTTKYKAIYRKYESKKFMRVSVFVEDYIIKTSEPF